METNYLLKHRESERAYHQIVDDFIVREDLYERAKYELETRGQDDSYHHFIYVGNRGSGKSTLLERIRYEINENEKLTSKYITIDFADETRDIYKLYDLWSKIILQLAEQGYDIEEPSFADYEDNMDEYSRESVLRINALLEKEDKTLVLFIDNIDRLFKNIKSDKSQLREVLLNYQNLRIFGGSTTMSESFWDYGEAFYEFFTIVQLEDLTKDEIYKLISHWTKKQGNPKLQKVIDGNPGKIEAIRIMTGGNPRMMISFMRMLLDNTLETGYDYLRMLIDDATMGYQEKLNYLSGQKGKIFSELAYLYESAQVDQLVQPCKMSSKTISAQLNALVKDNYVEKITTNNKNHLYRVRERFFNIWILMTQSSPVVRQKAKYLTDFLELFYSEKDIISFFENWKSRVASKGLSADKAILQAKALYHSKYINLDDQLEIYNTVSVMENVGLSVSAVFPEALKSVIKNAKSLVGKGRIDEAEKLLLDSISNSDKCKYVYTELGKIFQQRNKSKSIKYYLEAIEKGDFNALNNLAILYADIDEKEKAERYYLEAIEKGSINALFNLANLYAGLDEKEKAEKYYLEAIEKGHINALNNLAILYEVIDEKEKAEKYYLEAIEKGHISALNNLAILYKGLDKKEKAEGYYLEAIEEGDVDALYNLAILYKGLDEKEKAEKYYLEAIEKGHINALNNLAILYEDLDEKEKAEKYYLEAIEKGHINALNNLAILYEDLDEKEKAEKYYLEAIEKGNVNALFNLANLYEVLDEKEKAEKYYLEAIEKGHINALNNLAILYEGLDEKEKAEKYYLEAIEKGDVNALNNLAILYQGLDEKEKAEKYYLEAIEKGHVKALYNLAILYSGFDEKEKAEKYYKLAINHDPPAMLHLAEFYYLVNIKLSEALELVKRYLIIDNQNLLGQILANIIALASGKSQAYLDGRNQILERVIGIDSDGSNFKYLEYYLEIMLIHNQENWVISLFEGEKYGHKLKDAHLVLYYTAIQLLNSKDVRLNNMPPELGIPVMDMVDLIVEKRKVYYS